MRQLVDTRVLRYRAVIRTVQTYASYGMIPTIPKLYRIFMEETQAGGCHAYGSAGVVPYRRECTHL